MKQSGGFTLVEVVLVVVIIAVFAAISAPSTFLFIDQARSSRCESTRLLVERSYASYIKLHPGTTLLEFVTDKKYIGYGAADSCSKGRSYYVANDHIKCSRHSDGGEIVENDEPGGVTAGIEPGGITPANEPSGTVSPGDNGIYETPGVVPTNPATFHSSTTAVSGAFGPGGALDDDPNTRWQSDDGEYYAEIEFGFEQDSYINAVRFQQYKRRIASYVIEVKASGTNEWIRVASGVIDMRAPESAPDVSDYVTVRFDKVAASAVRVRFVNNSELGVSLWEIQALYIAD